jgi:hypothetical protein
MWCAGLLNVITALKFDPTAAFAKSLPQPTVVVQLRFVAISMAMQARRSRQISSSMRLVAAR